MGHQKRIKLTKFYEYSLLTITPREVPNTHTYIYIYIIWTLTKRLEKKLDGNYTKMLPAILNKSWRQHPTKTIRPPTSHQNYPSYTNHTCRTLLEKQGRAHKWLTPMDPHIWPSKAWRKAWTYIQQLCEDTGCDPEDLPEAMNDKEKWREISVQAARYIYIYIYTWIIQMIW